MTRKLLCFLLAATLFTACKKDDPIPPTPPVGEVPQTVLMYLPWAGASLYKSLLNNIEDAKKAVADGALGKGRLLVFIQNGVSTGRLVELYNWDDSCIEHPIKTYTDLNVTQAPVITGILGDATAAAPAKRYAMIIGSHGMAWVPAPGSKPAPMGLSAVPADPEKPHWEYVSPDGVFTRWFGDDSGVRNTNTTTLAEAIAAAGLHMDYILFDNCFMSSIEVAYDVRNVTDHIIASPCEVMGYGFPYETVVPQMFTDGGSTHSLEGICRAFYNFYEAYRAPDYNCGAVALTVTQELEPLAAVMKRINAACPPYVDNPANPLQQYEYLYYPTRFYDFGDYVSRFCTDKSLLAEFEQQMERTLPASCRLHTQYFYSGTKRLIVTYSGVSTSEPSTSAYVTPHFKNTAWYKATH